MACIAAIAVLTSHEGSVAEVCFKRTTAIWGGSGCCYTYPRVLSQSSSTCVRPEHNLHAYRLAHPNKNMSDIRIASQCQVPGRLHPLNTQSSRVLRTSDTLARKLLYSPWHLRTRTGEQAHNYRVPIVRRWSFLLFMQSSHTASGRRYQERISNRA